MGMGNAACGVSKENPGGDFQALLEPCAWLRACWPGALTDNIFFGRRFGALLRTTSPGEQKNAWPAPPPPTVKVRAPLAGGDGNTFFRSRLWENGDIFFLERLAGRNGDFFFFAGVSNGDLFSLRPSANGREWRPFFFDGDVFFS